MSQKNYKKGRSLEHAVRFIQQTILTSDPELKGTKFSIEPNKIVTVSGVRHEIDVFIKTFPGSRYESSWIFECKNWEKVVGKNEVIVLAAKVEAIGANRGFLIARNFSRDAVAQAAQDKRLKLVECTDQFLSPFDELELIHTVHTPGPVEISVRERGIVPPAEPKSLVWEDKACLLNGQPMKFSSFILQQVERLIADDRNQNALIYRLDGNHVGQRKCSIEFNPDEFKLGDMDVESMVLSVKFTILVRKKTLHSKFEIKDQGRIFSFEPIDDILPGKRLEIGLVQRL